MNKRKSFSFSKGLVGYSRSVSGPWKITDHVYLAGDYLLNGSINAAMTSGRIAAEAVIHSYMPTH